MFFTIKIFNLVSFQIGIYSVNCKPTKKTKSKRHTPHSNPWTLHMSKRKMKKVK